MLYIDDNLSNVKLVQQILGRQPALKLTVAMLGRRGLDLARHDRPDLVLLDLNLPDIPGQEILRALREDPRTSQIPVVIISADAVPSQIQRLLDQGAQQYLTMPLDVHRFLEVVHATLAGRKLDHPGSRLP